MNKCAERLYNGLIKENPTFVLTLGMCPTLAVTTSAINGIGMGLSSTVVLVMSNLIISLLRKVIPDGVRMPAFIVIVASFVTMVQFLMQGFLPSLYDSLGIYIPLIVVNCIILGRAEACASKNNVWVSIKDACVMGAGYAVAILSISVLRQFFTTGGLSFSNPLNMAKIFEFTLIPEEFTIALFGKPVGAFITFGILAAVFAAYKNSHDQKVAAALKKAKEAK